MQMGETGTMMVQAVYLCDARGMIGKRTKAPEDLMADVRPDVKRLRLTKTMDGNDV
jgi:hypothetical protein